MDLRGYFRVLRANWAIVLTLTVAAAGSSVLTSLLMHPSYESTARMYISTPGSGTTSELAQGNVFAEERVSTYLRISTSPAVLNPVIGELGLADSAKELAARMRVSSDKNTVVMNLSVLDSEPHRAAATASRIAVTVKKTVEILEKPRSQAESPVQLSIIAEPTVPANPTYPNVWLNAFVGLLIGLAAGLACAIIRSTQSIRVSGDAAVRAVTEGEILGRIPMDRTGKGYQRLSDKDKADSRTESFRQLRTNLAFSRVLHNRNSILVTSAVNGEGKSTTAVHLSMALAAAGHRVVLVDADLRTPTLHEQLGLEQSVGLSAVLVGDAAVSDVLKPWGDHELHVLTAGHRPPNPNLLLESTRSRDLWHELEANFDVVVIDAPSVLAFPDTLTVARNVMAVLLVVGDGVPKKTDLDSAVRALESVGAETIGVVLNGVRLGNPQPGPYAHAGNVSFSSSQRSQRRPRKGPRE